ncbi:MAG: histone deacetylase [Flavobacteriaceae bacterium]|nr:histone deacetylase [Flavobacteriaceae bacterium]MAU31427.1 histone deacetylase [Flavobacteriaceae bacterium]|tara:strand:- start:647 stop:1549 length:903 start_codon:yes stop_codon:yes gene_type:complete
MLKIAHDKIYNHPLKENHRFPMIKYELIPQQLIIENTCNENNFFNPGDLKDDVILLTHESNYYNKLINQKLEKKEMRAIGFPMSKKLIQREKKIVQGTIECALNSIKFGVSMNIAGGTHHAFTNRAEAFCILNDQAIAANFLIKNNYCQRILILDLDVHQGNGTAEIFRKNKNVFTASFHGEKNYPFRKEISDFDYGFSDGTSDQQYLDKIKYDVPRLIDSFKPDFIFYLSGVDIIKNDKLGRLSVSIKGCKERDRFVLNYCKTNRIPVQISMGGGYSPILRDIIEAHSNTFRLAQEIYF